VYLEESSLHSAVAARATRSDDLLLVEQLRRGDAEAGRRFVRAYYQDVYRYLLYLTGHTETAEDLTQETFVQAWRSLHTLGDRAHLRTWLHRIAHREFLQALRSHRRVLAQGMMVSLEEVADLSEPRAAELTKAAELRVMIGRLPTEEREMVVLHYLEGYNSEEIADIMGVPAGTVRYRLYEARARLRSALSEEEPGDRGSKR
jgi:RNA polymerase sigma-70 factor (ECF subfamily)